MPVVLETPRLRLRPMTEADADNLHRLSQSANVNRFIGETPLADVAAGLAIFRDRIEPQYRQHGVGRLAIELRPDGAFAGWCGLKYRPDTDEYDLGYRLLEELWGRGLATEAAAAVLDWARRALPGARIVGRALAENHASVRVLQKLGLVFHEHCRDHDGPSVLYRLVL